MDRHAARRTALELLYQHEFAPDNVDEALAERELGTQRRFVEGLVNGVREHLQAIDALLAPRTVGWRYARLTAVDRSILRLGAYELLFSGETPAEVVLNEAVELSREYGSDQAPSFVNGILDRLWKERRPANGPPSR
jgi:N utilization substance protein B